MTDNEIIKALECCIRNEICCVCGECPLDTRPQCEEVLYREVVDLINRQKAENEELKCRNQNLTSDLTSAKAEIEKLKRTPKCVYAYDGETMEYCVEGPCSAEKLIETIKSEAYKEFVKRFEKKIKNVNFTIGQTWEIQCALKQTAIELSEVSDNA